MSFAGAQNVATQYPQYADQIMAAAKTAFLAGDDKAYLAGIIAVVIGAALVVLFFPKQAQEQELFAGVPRGRRSGLVNPWREWTRGCCKRDKCRVPVVVLSPQQT
ncbi:MAG: hypothetical protein R2851_09360 [Caldilineaceae bacterium]